MAIISCGKGGSALRRSAYQRCAESENGKFDYSDKADEFVHSEVMLPENAPDEFSDSDKLWQAAEDAENRVDAQVARTLDIAIQDEVPEHLWAGYARELMEFYVDNGFAVEYSIQSSNSIFRNRANVHIHAMMSMREVTEDGFAKRKNRDFNQVMRKEGGHYMRRKGADTMNAFFDKHGIDAHVCPEQKEDRDAIKPVMPKSIIRELTRHEGDYKRHQAAGGKDVDFPNRLSPSAEKYAREYIEHREAVKKRDEAISRARQIHEGITRETLDKAHDALDAFMSQEPDHRKSMDELDAVGELTGVDEKRLSHGDKMMLELAKIRTENNESAAVRDEDTGHSHGAANVSYNAPEKAEKGQDDGHPMTGFENAVRSYEKASQKGETAPRCDRTANHIADSVSDGTFATLSGKGDAAVSAFLKAWSASMQSNAPKI